MATIKPFRGVRYNPQKIADLSTVISQPHDRVRYGLKEKYYDLSPHNVARIIKGKTYPDDDQTNNTFTRARDSYRDWQREGVLMREEKPAFYVLQQEFALPDGTVKKRIGLVAALELSTYDKGIILPHERTLTKSMTERLELLRATDTNFGSVFMLYPGSGINELLAPIVKRPPTVEAREMFEHDVIQRFWVVDDPELIEAITTVMTPKRRLVIADGHHRYETALKHREEMCAQYPDAPANAGFNYRLVTLVSMEDPGLVILPTHRMIQSYGQLSTDEILRRAEEYFNVEPVADRQALEDAMTAIQGEQRPYFGFHNGTSALVTLRDPRVMAQLLPERSPTWRTLDVAVLHELFIERVLGMDKHKVELKEGIEFLRNPEMGYQAVEKNEAACVLLMRPTRIEQVQACSAGGERMPQKSTDFYPKIISGLVALPVGAEERL